jgi:hypothetical protein
MARLSGQFHAEQGTAADAFQRPLRSRFQARLSAGVRRLDIQYFTFYVKKRGPDEGLAKKQEEQCAKRLWHLTGRGSG